MTAGSNRCGGLNQQRISRWFVIWCGWLRLFSIAATTVDGCPAELMTDDVTLLPQFRSIPLVAQLVAIASDNGHAPQHPQSQGPTSPASAPVSKAPRIHWYPDPPGQSKFDLLRCFRRNSNRVAGNRNVDVHGEQQHSTAANKVAVAAAAAGKRKIWKGANAESSLCVQ